MDGQRPPAYFLKVQCNYQIVTRRKWYISKLKVETQNCLITKNKSSRHSEYLMKISHSPKKGNDYQNTK